MKLILILLRVESMPAKKRLCVSCKERKDVLSGYICNVGFLCSEACRKNYGQKNTAKILNKVRATKEKAIKVRHKVRTKELRTRIQWYAMLQIERNRNILIRDRGKPCCTCGATNPNIKYDAGHMFAVGRGGADRRRFNEFNIHKQCSVQCNQHGSGMREEYRQFIIETYGPDRLAWLTDQSNFPTLKEQFPHWTDIEKEILRYRKLNKLQEGK